ncbi:MAG: ADP-ribosylglycohydrolase family protein [Defluviitaleaceae bacterium]|nr:ADP-ribosylglycohydrolase family protein [Defluviitaleaceae bacterium]
MDTSFLIKSVLFGTSTGDAIGVPVEFKSREYLKNHPVKDMTGYGTYNQPPGTFSDDSSLTFCLAEALTHDFDLSLISENFLKWKQEAYWTAANRVFDIGIATNKAINNLKNNIRPELAGGINEDDNGNGSLMRISPLVFYIYKMPISERYSIIKKVSSITHGHIRSIISCFYYLEFMISILTEKNLFKIYDNLKITISEFLKELSIDQVEIGFFDRLLKYNIYELSEDQIESGGYVIETLEASIWCLLTTNNYKEAVLKAVNLGSDTDTTGCVIGAIAGLYYGYNNIPEDWINKIKRKKDIENLAERLSKKIK